MNNVSVLDLRWHGKLPEKYGKTFDNIAYLIRNEFIDLIDQASSGLHDNLDWWIEGPASRNYFSSPLFHHCCSLALLEQLATQEELPKIVYVDSNAFYDVLQIWISGNGIKMEVRKLPKIGETLLLKFFGCILRPTKSAIKLLFQYAASRNYNEYNKLTKVSQSLILIDTFVLDEGEGKDRYYPGLWDNLRASDKRRTFFVPEFEKNSIL